MNLNQELRSWIVSVMIKFTGLRITSVMIFFPLVLVPGIGCPWSLFKVYRVSLVIVPGIQGVPGHCSRYTGCSWSLFQLYRVTLVLGPGIQGVPGPWSRYTGCPWSLVQVYRVSLVPGSFTRFNQSKERCRVFLVPGPGTGCPWTLVLVQGLSLFIAGLGGFWSRYAGCPWSKYSHRVSLVPEH